MPLTPNNKSFLLFLMLCCAQLNAQFDGLNSFFDDPLWLMQVKTSGVKSVTEFIVRDTMRLYNGHFYFDRQGRRTELCRPYGRGFRRIQTAYTESNLVSKEINFHEEDSAKIDYWRTYSYDTQGRLMKEGGGSYENGLPKETIIQETRILSANPSATRSVIYNYIDAPNEPVSLLDSVSGIYTYAIRYEYRPDDADEKGRKRGQKKFKRSYVKNGRLYEDNIDYTVYGRIETAKELKTYYYQYDIKKRLIEFGEINYEEAYLQFVQQHPEEISFYTMSPKFIKAVLGGKVSGKKEAKTKCTYDAGNRLIAKMNYGTNYKFNYNKKGQMVEQTSEGYQNLRDELFYNDKGLVNKVISRLLNANESGNAKQPQEVIYTYTYY